jgi:hypothetical protein
MMMPSGRWMLCLGKNPWSSLLNQNHTCTLTILPKQYRARLVANGFSQRPGTESFQTYFPVVKYDSLRAILAVTADEDLVLFQLYVTTAILGYMLS